MEKKIDLIAFFHKIYGKNFVFFVDFFSKKKKNVLCTELQKTPQSAWQHSLVSEQFFFFLFKFHEVFVNFSKYESYRLTCEKINQLVEFSLSATVGMKNLTFVCYNNFSCQGFFFLNEREKWKEVK